MTIEIEIDAFQNSDFISQLIILFLVSFIAPKVHL